MFDRSHDGDLEGAQHKANVGSEFAGVGFRCGRCTFLR
jgi:hypothetical protein